MRKGMLAVLSFCLLMPMVMALGTNAADSGEGMPGVVSLDSLQGKYGAVRFDHALHTQMSEGCAQCHHTHGSDNSRCKDCHSIGIDDFRGTVVRSFMACGTCHGEFDKESPGMPGLKVAYHSQCFGCHIGMGNVGNGPKGCTEQCHEKALQ
jgi:hypothetical protein